MVYVFSMVTRLKLGSTLRLARRAINKIRRILKRRKASIVPVGPGVIKDAYRRTATAQLTSFLAERHHLHLPAAEEPLVSIILVLHNQAPLTLQCLQSIRETVACPAEVIIVDNASSDETSRLLSRTDGAIVVRNRENEHFLRGCNQAARMARGEFILLLNNDARLMPGALDAALSTMTRADDIGVVGGKIVLLDGSLQEAGSIVLRDGSCIGYGRGDSPAAPMYMFRRDVDFCSGAFFLIRGSLFESLGGFDEAFAPAYYEEVDLCLRARQRGYRTVYEPAAVIMHYEFGSSSSSAEAIALQSRNHTVFIERHREALSARARAGPDRVLEARSLSKGRSRVLFIEDRVPHPGLGRGYPRSQAILVSLVELRHFVTLYPLIFPEEPWEKVYTDIPREVEVMNGWGPSHLLDFLEERKGYYDTALVCRPMNMGTFLSAANQNPKVVDHTRIIYDAEAVFVMRTLLEMRLKGKVMLKEAIDKEIAEEVALAGKADQVLSVCERERQFFSAHGIRNTQVLGHSLSLRPTPNGFAARKHLLFVGAIPDEFCPNGESIIWFVENVFPAVAEKLGGDVQLLVVGFNEAERVRALATEQVRMLGYVEDVEELYGRSRIFIAPTRFAAGVPLKVYEAAAHGLPVAASSLVASQLRWESGRDLIVAEGTDAGAFAEACIRLYTDEELWWKLRRSALARTEMECSPEAFLQTVSRLFG